LLPLDSQACGSVRIVLSAKPESTPFIFGLAFSPSNLLSQSLDLVGVFFPWSAKRPSMGRMVFRLGYGLLGPKQRLKPIRYMYTRLGLGLEKARALDSMMFRQALVTARCWSPRRCEPAKENRSQRRRLGVEKSVDHVLAIIFRLKHIIRVLLA